MSILNKNFDRASSFFWLLISGGIGVFVSYLFACFVSKNLGFSKQLAFINDVLFPSFGCSLSDIDALKIAIGLPVFELFFLCAASTLLSMWLSKKIALKFLRSPF